MAETSSNKPNITLYTDSTPNGQKVSIALEELGLEYETIHIDISKNTKKEEWFLRINQNGRTPALTDRAPTKDSKEQEVNLFEGGAILLYLVQRYDKNHAISWEFDSAEFDSAEYWEMLEWLVWMQNGLGPMQGQANHFYRYAPEKIEYGIKRYQNETKRLYTMVNTHLLSQRQHTTSSNPWLVDAKISLADISCFAWINWCEWAGIDLSRATDTSEEAKVEGKHAGIADNKQDGEEVEGNFKELRDWQCC